MGNVKPWRCRLCQDVTRREALQTMGACQPQPLGDTRVKLNPRTLLPLAPAHIRPVAEALLNEAEDAAKRLEATAHVAGQAQTSAHQAHMRLTQISEAVRHLVREVEAQAGQIRQLTEALAPANTGKAVH